MASLNALTGIDGFGTPTFTGFFESTPYIWDVAFLTRSSKPHNGPNYTTKAVFLRTPPAEPLEKRRSREGVRIRR